MENLKRDFINNNWEGNMSKSKIIIQTLEVGTSIQENADKWSSFLQELRQLG